MMKFYNENQFDEWANDFQKETNCQIDQNQLNVIKNWVNNSKKPLSEIFEINEFSCNGECYKLNDDVIVKTSKYRIAQLMSWKIEQYPNLNNYIIPTYVYSFKNQHELDDRHIDYIIRQNKNIKYYSDCLILQQHCILFDRESEYYKYYNEHKAKIEVQNLLTKYKLDLNFRNAGYLNGEIKYFDW